MEIICTSRFLITFKFEQLYTVATSFSFDFQIIIFNYDGNKFMYGEFNKITKIFSSIGKLKNLGFFPILLSDNYFLFIIK